MAGSIDAPGACVPANTVTTYGMTETGSGVVYDGIPLEGVEVRVDPSDGAPGSDGEIFIRGPMLMRAYRDGSSPLDEHGWLPTGDIGRWLDDGRLHVVGRAGELIVTGGENVWPEAVEKALLDHPGVAEVMVRGRHDDEWGQAVEAVVVPSGAPPTLDSLRNHVKERHPAFMAPRRLEIVAQLPRTALGKLRRIAV